MHRAGILNRDLKGANIIVGTAGQGALKDWDIANAAPGDAAQAMLIDLDGCRFSSSMVTCDTAGRLKNLTRLAVGMSQHAWMTARSMRAFLEGYTSVIPDPNLADLWRELAVRVPKEIERRKATGEELF